MVAALGPGTFAIGNSGSARQTKMVLSGQLSQGLKPVLHSA